MHRVVLAISIVKVLILAVICQDNTMEMKRTENINQYKQCMMTLRCIIL